MIIYFSGTGNSKYIAEKLAELLKEELFKIEGTNRFLPVMTDDEPLGIIFPVYAWGLPKIVTDFLKTKTITNKFLWSVMTCGDDMGYADEILAKVLKRKIDAVFSLQMPNTYVCLPGFDVDSPELAEKKIRESTGQIPRIAQCIKSKEEGIEVTRGDAAWIKTYFLRPLFNAFLVTDKYFRTSNECSSCGLCAKQCPMLDIVMVSGKPIWKNKNCTGCLRCYHKCPKHAIDWGQFTKCKGLAKPIKQCYTNSCSEERVLV